ncbi:hypothetical protein [Streptomyces sp. SID10853]|uniref:hypothetical protein n=1 Tax=Streptomyces sp. SID10853 TaxID=2706028 RepID=UPI00194588FA|nr:hypothetical protein [Streptomyces sp. SID10853]
MAAIDGRMYIEGRRVACPSDLEEAADQLECSGAVARIGPEAMLKAFVDVIVDGYAPVVAGLMNDIDEIEDSLFGEGNEHWT